MTTATVSAVTTITSVTTVLLLLLLLDYSTASLFDYLRFFLSLHSLDVLCPTFHYPALPCLAILSLLHYTTIPNPQSLIPNPRRRWSMQPLRPTQLSPFMRWNWKLGIRNRPSTLAATISIIAQRSKL